MKLVVGHWLIDSQENQIIHVDTQEIIKLEPRAMEVFLYFVQKPDEVISRDELIENVWQGRVVSDHAVYRTINLIRRALDENDKDTYLTTIPKKGYKLIQSVSEYIETKPNLTDSKISTDKTDVINIIPLSMKYGLIYGGILILLGIVWHYFLASKWNYYTTPIYSNMQPLTPDEYLEEYPHFSKDGNHIIYSQKKSQSSTYDLYIKNFHTKKVSQVTDDTSNWINATLSNQAKTIIAVKSNVNDCKVVAFSLVDKKYNQKELFECKNNTLIDIDISSDGSILYYTYKDQHNETNRVFSYLMRTGKKVQLTNFLENSALGDHILSLSPDNKKLAFLRNDHYEETAIMLFDLETNKESLISKVSGWVWSLSWDSSGNGVVYQTSGNKIEYQSLEHDFRKALVSIPTTIRRINHSGGSDNLAIVKQESQYGVWKFMNPHIRGSSHYANSSKRLLVTNSLDYFQTFANTSKTFAFMSTRSGQQQIWLYSEDGELRQLTKFEDPRIVLHICWSPNDKYIAIYSFGNKKVSIIDTESGVETILVSGDGYSNASLPTWSNDGKSVFFTSDKNQDYDLYEVSLNEKHVKKHTSDGRYWLYQRGNQNFYLKSNKDGLWYTDEFYSDILLIKNIDESVYQSINIKDNNIYYQDSKNKNIYVYQINTKQTTLVELLAKPVAGSGISVSYDEKSIIFSDVFKQASKIFLLSPED